jgi:acyl-CoA synthetase (AMP-forming)/AMP-acid ligase II
VNITLLLDIVSQALGERMAVTCEDRQLTYADLVDRSGAFAASIDDAATTVALVDGNSATVPVALFGAARAGLPFAPVNYRLADDRLSALVDRLAPAAVVADVTVAARLGEGAKTEPIPPADLVDPVVGTTGEAEPAEGAATDPDDVAVLLFTSGTTGEPKAAVLRHRHLTSYVLNSVEPFSAGEDEATLVSLPPYHVAGIMVVLSSVYAGRRLVYLPQFEPEAWVRLARDEAVTHAMVVPTMLRRIVEVLEADGGGLPSLRHLACGGGRMPSEVVEAALALLPDVDFVNAYGLTETSSTVSVLGPEDHRVAVGSDDEAVRARLGSVGRPLPALTVEIRDDDGAVVPAGERGEIWVRGEQVAGEYQEAGSVLVDGWFPTRDGGRFDEDGYLYIEGRVDDVIVRGGENLSPGEIEVVLAEHPSVAEAAVVGVPDVEWGEAVVAAVVRRPGAEVDEAELQDLVRSRLRSTRTPERITFVDELPYNETGKLLRRTLRQDLAD